MSEFDKKLFDGIKPDEVIIIKKRNLKGKLETIHKIELIQSLTSKRFHIKYNSGINTFYGNGSKTRIFSRLRELMV